MKNEKKKVKSVYKLVLIAFMHSFILECINKCKTCYDSINCTQCFEETHFYLVS